MAKPVFKSKTIIVNLLGIVVMIMSHWGVVVPEGMVSEIGASLALINLVLRMVTSGRVALFPDGPVPIDPPLK